MSLVADLFLGPTSEWVGMPDIIGAKCMYSNIILCIHTCLCAAMCVCVCVWAHWYRVTRLCTCVG